MTHTHRTSFLILLGLLFLLPLFFIPHGLLTLEVGKATLFALGTILLTLAFLAEYFREGRLTLPWHPLILAAIFLPVVYLISSLMTQNHNLSLFGYTLEPGTFGFMLLAAFIFLITALISTNNARIVHTVRVVMGTLGFVALFALAKILTGGTALSFGIFTGNMGNSIGGWTDLAVALGLLSILSAIAVEMLPTNKTVRIILGTLFLISTALFAIVDFSTAILFTLVVSVLLFVYFLTVERKSEESAGKKRITPWPIGVLLVLSLIFVINPVVSSKGKLSEVVSSSFGVSNTDIRPSLATTLTISKAVLSKDALLGSGPNTFDRDWLIHKPADINTTPYWQVSFPYGVGFIPTQVASTGIIGSLLWILFFLLLIFMGIRTLRLMPEDRGERFALVSTFSGAAFLWMISFLYVPSEVLLVLAFVFTALFLSAARSSGIVASRQIVLSKGPSANIISAVFGLALIVGCIILGFAVFQRTASAYYFGKALTLSNTSGAALADVEGDLDKAIKLSPQDVYYSALARVNFAKAQSAVHDQTSATADRQQLFQTSIASSIAAARSATVANPGNYANWIMLGSIYASLVSNPPSIDGAYESAKAAYLEASKLNPATPEVPLLLARLEFANGNVDLARSHVHEATALKPDYADAYLFLTQLEVSQNNLPEAIKSAENWALLTPQDAGIFFELGLLKYSNKDYVGARMAFEHALSLTPDYANAEYYLGLTLIQQGDLAAATPIFENLAKTNPDNTDLTAILNSLHKGKAPNLTPVKK